MKLLRVGQKGNEKPAVLDADGKIRDISSHVSDLNPDYVNFDTISKLQNIDLSSLPELSSSERIGSCISKPGKFVAIGLNYSDHAAETGAEVPSEPITFMKATSSINGPNDDIEIVSGSTKLDWEVELGIIIGKEAKHVSEDKAQEHILGYCLVNDISEREWQIEKMGQWVKGKSHDTYGPIGPYLVTKDDIADINNLKMSLDVNGNRMQTGNTSTMIFNVNVIVSYVSKFMSLQAGDIITTGTPPGVGMGMKPQQFLKAGDTMKLSIENLGEQNSKVVALYLIVKITSIKSHVLRYELETELGYSQQYYKHRTAHLVKVETDEGITGWGECFGPGNIALANKYIVEKVIQPLIVGEDPSNKEYIWHKVYNLLRDSGQKGMPIQALSGIDIALWDILGKKTNTPLYQLVGGKCNDQIPVYGYGMMLQKKSVDELVELFKEEAKQIKSKNFKAMKMKIGLGPKEDLKLVQAVREAIGKDFKLMVDANHAYNVNDALYVGRGLDELDIFWFEEPVAPENYDGYKELKQKINTNIAGGEGEFTKYGWNELIKNKCIDIAQPEVCGLGGITEYLKVSAIAQSNFIPVINHVWGSAVSIAVNLHLLIAQPDMPGGLFPSKPMLEFDTTEKNIFITDLPQEDFSILDQVKQNNGFASITDNPGIGITPNEDFIKEFEINE